MLMNNERGERITKTFRCADLDSEIPILMGVSKAILHNVVFCHQEESNWPLGDSSTLKKKFDEIFSATRYTKALDILKKQRNELLQEIKVLKERLSHSQTIQNNYKRVEEDIEFTNTRISATENEIEEYERSLKQHEKEKLIKEETLKVLREKSIEMERYRAQRVELTKKSEEYQKNIDILLCDTLENIHKMLYEYDQQVEKSKEEVSRLQMEVESLEQDRNMYNKKHQDLIQKRILGESMEQATIDFVAQLKEGISEFNAVIQTETNLKIDLTNLKIDITRVDIDLTNCDDIVGTCHSILNQMEEEYRLSVASNEKLIEEKKRILDEMKMKLHKFKTDFNIHRNDRDKAKEDKISLEKELQVACESLVKVDDLKLRLTQDQQKLQVHLSQFDEEMVTQQIKVLTEDRDACSKRIEETSEKIQTSTNIVLIRSKYDQLQNALQDKQDKYRSLINDHASLFKQYMIDIDSTGPEECMKMTEHLLTSTSERECASKNSLDSILSKVNNIEGQISLTLENVEQMKEKLQSLMLNTKMSIRDGDPSVLLSKLNDEIGQLSNDIASLNAAKKVYSDMEVEAEVKKCCPLCDRNLETMDSLRSKIEHLIQNIPQTLVLKEAELDEKRDIKKHLESAQDVFREYVQYDKTEIPQAEKKIIELEKRKANLKIKVDKYEKDLVDEQSQKEEIQVLNKVCHALCNLADEIKLIQSQRSVEEDKLLKLGNVTPIDAKELEHMQHSLVDMKSRHEELNEALHHIQKESQEQKNTISTLERSIALLEKDISISSTLESSMSSLRAKIDLKHAQIEKLEALILEREALLDTLSVEIENTMKEESSVKTSMKLDEDEKRKHLDAVRTKFMRIKDMVQRLQSHMQKVQLNSLVHINKEISQLETDMDRLDHDISDKMRQSQEIKQRIASSASEKRNIEDNIKYCTCKQEITFIDNNMANIEQFLVAHYSTQDIQMSISPVLRDAEILEQLMNDIKTRCSQLQGSKMAYLEDLENKRKQLRSLSSSGDVNEKYRESFINLKTAETACLDIERYYKALDKALMKYHSQKMGDINTIIKELWQNTYKGKDIDTIEIKSEFDASSKRQSYNYRVVMIKGDSELDMKGRCSTGQKVLASLVIRLALAETFCINCGILALDEPTTNLDRANVESLASSLVSIIESRRKQDNFQLIVITHDEEFVQNLGRSDYCDYYWRVSKNSQQHSTIVKKQIVDL